MDDDIPCPHDNDPAICDGCLYERQKQWASLLDEHGDIETLAKRARLGAAVEAMPARRYMEHYVPGAWSVHDRKLKRMTVYCKTPQEALDKQKETFGGPAHGDRNDAG